MPAELAELLLSLDTQWKVVAGRSKNGLTCKLPVYVRKVGPEQFGLETWSLFCKQLCESGIPTFSSVDALSTLALNQVPRRIHVHGCNQNLDIRGVESADAIEIDCWNERQQRWTWSSELQSNEDLRNFIELCRIATDFQAPIGVRLPVHVHQADLQKSLSAGVDFITLRSGPLQPELNSFANLFAIAKARKACCEAGRPEVNLLVDADIENCVDVPKAIALGASALCVDRLLASTLLEPRISSSTSLLASIEAVASTRRDLSGVTSRVRELEDCLKSAMAMVGAVALSDLRPSMLLATSRVAADLLAE